jgi:hypothetical protein
MELFAGTYIGQHPSTMAGKYLVLALDFSQVIGGDIPASFTEVVNASVSGYSDKYYEGGFLKRPVTINEKNFASSMSNMANAVELSGHKLSLIVDEVDSFANRLLLHVSREKALASPGYTEFVVREGSVLRDFGRVVKSASNTCIERMFFTGVMPVARCDAFASLNTVEDLTHTDAFEEALGFKSSDIEELLARRFPAMGPEERAKHLASIRCTCIGYRRSSSQVEALYNPQGVWFYLKQLQDKGDRMVPRMDPNIVQPVRDEVVAFLVKQAAGTFSRTLSGHRSLADDDCRWCSTSRGDERAIALPRRRHSFQSGGERLRRVSLPPGPSTAGAAQHGLLFGLPVVPIPEA